VELSNCIGNLGIADVYMLHMSLKSLSDGEVVLYIHAQHLQSATATDSRQWCQISSATPLPPAIGEDHFARFITIQPQVVMLGPASNVVQFGLSGYLVGGWNDYVGVIGKLAQCVPRSGGG